MMDNVFEEVIEEMKEQIGDGQIFTNVKTNYTASLAFLNKSGLHLKIVDGADSE
mgnify:CR=1 FL=1